MSTTNLSLEEMNAKLEELGGINELNKWIEKEQKNTALKLINQLKPVIETGNVDEILLIVGSTIRFEIFKKLNEKHQLNSELFAYALRQAYSMSDNLYKHKNYIKHCFGLVDKNYLMNDDEMNYLNSLPDEIMIHRGMTVTEKEGGNFGISWTLKKETAEFFAFNYSRNSSTRQEQKTTHSMCIPKEKAIAFFNDRQEFEVIYLDSHVGEVYGY